MSGLSSRIPKLTYGSKRAMQTSGTHSRESTPVQCNDDRGTSKSAPGVGVSVGRSRSLKLPRKQYLGGVLGSSSTSKLESSRHQQRAANGGPNLKDKESSSSPNSSRASSPGNAMTTNHVDFASSTEVSGTDSDLTKSSSENPFLRRRAQSFGPNLRRPVNTRHLRPPAGNRSRGSTPTPRGGTPTPRSVTPSSLPVPSSRRAVGGASTPSGHRHLRSRSSLGSSSVRVAMVTEEDSAGSSSQKPLRIRRADSNDVIDGGVVNLVGGGQGREVRTTGGKPPGKRPNSYIIREPADLNQLAHEITRSYENSLDAPEVKSVAKVHSVGHSGRVGVASAGHTPLSSRRNVQGGMGSKSRSTSSDKISSLGRGTKHNFTAALNPSEHGGTTAGKIQTPRGTLTSRSSTSSSGRSTPVGGERRNNRVSPPGAAEGGTTTTPAGGLSGSRLPAPAGSKWSQRKVIRVREPRPVGINELEGAVLMDSDEYLKISHEVKAIKTTILKLKRELQSGETEEGEVTNTGPTHLTSKSPRRQPPRGQVADGDRINTLAAEKAKAVGECEQLKKKQKIMSDKLEKATSDLKKSEEENKKLTERLQQIETHRDLLLDKVERLHADKHKLEDRLRSLEKAQLYEESSSVWLEGEEGDGGDGGEGGKWEDTLMLGEKTESDVGENSEPESSAVCGGPNSSGHVTGHTTIM